MSIEDASRLALIYAETKLNEFQVENREALARGNVKMSDEEIQYLESAYWFAFKRLS